NAQRKPILFCLLILSVEKPAPVFPRNGKTLRDFSTQWKKFDGFFHTMENLWGDFSTQWKMFDDFFHTVEKIFPHCGKVSRGRVAAGRAA
ncbi:MAG TPA: hypothetical protein PLJ55_03305, partial [Kiritimatiellia bacterium]|nr:hypothetical protein [Kiritimatiellia bacterium]